MSRTKKFILNSMSSAFSQVIVMLSGFIIPNLMIRTYGSEINGLVSSINQMIGYISLVEAGLSGAAIYSLYKPLANNDIKEINGIVSAARKFYLQAGYIFSILVLILAFTYAQLKSSEILSYFDMLFLTIILGMNGCVDFFILSRYRVILTADQKTYLISIIGIIQMLIRIVIIIFGTSIKMDVILLYLLSLTSVIIKVIILTFYCKKRYKFLNFNEQPNIKALDRRYDVIYQQILGMIQTGAPVVIATLVLDLFSVSIYSIYNMIMSGINGILGIFISGLPAAFGEVIAKKEKSLLKEATSQFEVMYYFLLINIYGITFATILPFIKIYTRNFIDVNYILPVFAFVIVLNGLLYNIKTPQSMLIISAGMYKETRWRVTIQGLIIVIGGFAFSFLGGLTGIMVASCISNLYRTIDLIYFVPKYITHLSYKISLFRMMRVFLGILIINTPLYFFKIELVSYVDWFFYVCVLGIWSLLISVILTVIFDSKEFFCLYKRVKNILKRG